MGILFKKANVFRKGEFSVADVFVKDGMIVSVSSDESLSLEDVTVIDCSDRYLFPGLVDVHVHLREPGFSYKETVESGTKAAAHGGYTSVCAMPNLSPVPDTAEHLAMETQRIHEGAFVHVYPYAAITLEEKGETLVDFPALAENAIAFSDDGRGVQSEEMMRTAMKNAVKLDKIIAAHCEDNSLLRGGYIHDGAYAKEHGHRGICSESEWGPIARDIRLAEATGCRYHVCHISAKESVALIREAKKRGVNISCETGPHYLVLNDSMLQEDGRFKMNPPLRAEEDQKALIEGLLDGTIDMIATDHAPHSEEEKSRGLEKSLMGITGLETAFAVMYTEFVKCGVMSLEKLLQLMHDNPAKRFGIGSHIEPGATADLTLFDLNKKWTVCPDTFLSKGKSTPFKGKELYGACLLTLVDGKVAYAADGILENGEEVR